MIGISREIKDLNRLYSSGRAEPVAVYGRQFGLRQNEYSSAFTNVVTMDDLY